MLCKSMWRLLLVTETPVLYAWRGFVSIPCPFALACILFFLVYVSILLIIHKCPLSLPFPFPPLSSPVAIIEPTTTSASSPGQYMSPCCTPNQKRGPLPHINLS